MNLKGERQNNKREIKEIISLSDFLLLKGKKFLLF